jgi:oligopeptidase A
VALGAGFGVRRMSFLDRSFHPRWSSLTPERVVPDITALLAGATLAIDALTGQDRGRLTFDSVFGGYERALEALNEAWGQVSHLDSVCNSEALRAAHHEMLPRVTEFYTRLTLNATLWDLFLTYSRTEEARSLTGVRLRLLEETLADFRLNGAELPPEKKRRLEEIEGALAQSTQKFSENVLDSTNAWDRVITDPLQIAGLPASARAAAQADAAAKGHGTADVPAWRFTLKAPSLVPALEHLDDEALREEIWRASSGIGRTGAHDNTQNIWDILRLRQEKAELLGFGHFADLVLNRRMAKTGHTALHFTHDLRDRIVEAFRREVRGLQEFQAEALHQPAAPLQPWTASFWAEKQRVQLYDFDEEELRPFFPIDGVLRGLFQVVETLFGLSIVERETVFGPEAAAAVTVSPEEGGPVEVWHPEVKFYDVQNAAGEAIGSFYADWHPRDAKRGGAWMNYLRTGTPAQDGRPRQPHLGLIAGNLSPSTPGKPALLSHGEVETVFHEFGHLLHHLLGEVPVKSLNGVNVAWDFVELPSQIMENFCWERVSLDLFARHFETGEPIPDRLFKKMLSARNYLSAMGTMRQLNFAKLDLDLHMRFARSEGRDLDLVAEEILEGWQVPLGTKAPTISRRFTHLFGSSVGYAAGYYSYKWAEVLDADAFSRFKEDGVLSAKVGAEFRETILSQGNAADPAVLFRRFMGRDPQPEALLRRSGLV